MSNRIEFDRKNNSAFFVFEQLNPLASVDSFSCQMTEYNDYLIKEALRAQKDRMAITWLLKERATGKIAAYMSLIADAIKLSTSEKELHTLDYPFKTVPAMKIAKLAVDNTFRNTYCGIGSFMIDMASFIADTCNQQFFACRFITVDADIEHNESVIGFYRKNGFISNAEMNNKRSKTVSMRKDIFIQDN
jgi:ribosomal protein S18 acetylase RimI-like enzyme